MDDKRFWDVISVACPHDVPPHEWRLTQELRKLPPADIVAFDWRFDDLTGAAYREDLWEAANWINGGASDDGFYYFRCWLVGMGKTIYEAALADPDSLADTPPRPGWEAEAEIYSAARRAWEGLGLPEDDFDRAYKALGPNRARQKLVKADWDTDDIGELRRRWPRMVAAYNVSEDEDDE